MECKVCGAQIENNVERCNYCSAPVTRPPSTGGGGGIGIGNIGNIPAIGNSPAGALATNRVLVGVCAILLGSLGVHKFILGYYRAGLILLLLTVVSFGRLGYITGVFGLIEGIIYLTKTNQVFVDTYVVKKKEWL